MAKVVYIGGYGRSGSTLLEYLMTANPKLVACGEVASCWRKKLTLSNTCTCGRSVQQCSVWHVFFGAKNATHWTHLDLSLALLEQISTDFELMVDSSKTAWGATAMPFKLRQKLGNNFHLIHVVRDPRAVCWSLIQSKKKHAVFSNPALRCIWTTLAWGIANLSCECFHWLHPDQYVRVHYEDLARRPGDVLNDLFKKLLPNAPWGLERIGSNDNRHQLHGNRMRKQSLSLNSVREDLRWRKEMPLGLCRLVAALTRSMRARYGYA
jgi:hypothetical protein